MTHSPLADESAIAGDSGMADSTRPDRNDDQNLPKTNIATNE